MTKEIDFSDKKKLEETIDKVLIPELHTKKAVLAGNEVELHPLPVANAKKISKDITEVRELITSTINVENPENIPPDFDLKIMDALISAVRNIADFYKLGLSLEEISSKCSTSELLNFIEVQLEVNGENDFLLLPLRVIIHGAKATGMINLEENIPTS